MEDKKELHPVVKLVLARMESHPEEFNDDGAGRWDYVLDVIEDNGNDEEKAAIASGLRVIRLEEAHKWMMDELLHGESRRAEHECKEEELRMQIMQAHAQARVAQNIQTLSAQSLPSAYQNSITHSPTLHIGGETLDAGMVRKIKNKLGI